MTVWSSRRWQIGFGVTHWMLGVSLPHGGMLVWTLYLGPLQIHFWPHAPKLEEMPF